MPWLEIWEAEHFSRGFVVLPFLQVGLGGLAVPLSLQNPEKRKVKLNLQSKHAYIPS